MNTLSIVIVLPLTVTKRATLSLFPYSRTVVFPPGRIELTLENVTGPTEGIFAGAGGDVLKWRFFGELPHHGLPTDMRWILNGEEHDTGIPIGRQPAPSQVRKDFEAAQNGGSIPQLLSHLVALE
jgi:hypothetical protein